jgi:hypothetical protein
VTPLCWVALIQSSCGAWSGTLITCLWPLLCLCRDRIASIGACVQLTQMTTITSSDSCKLLSLQVDRLRWCRPRIRLSKSLDEGPGIPLTGHSPPAIRVCRTRTLDGTVWPLAPRVHEMTRLCVRAGSGGLGGSTAGVCDCPFRAVAQDCNRVYLRRRGVCAIVSVGADHRAHRKAKGSPEDGRADRCHINSWLRPLTNTTS